MLKCRFANEKGSLYRNGLIFPIFIYLIINRNYFENKHFTFSSKFGCKIKMCNFFVCLSKRIFSLRKNWNKNKGFTQQKVVHLSRLQNHFCWEFAFFGNSPFSKRKSHSIIHTLFSIHPIKVPADDREHGFEIIFKSFQHLYRKKISFIIYFGTYRFFMVLLIFYHVPA